VKTPTATPGAPLGEPEAVERESYRRKKVKVLGKDESTSTREQTKRQAQ
jgi:hypothetical protein